jgi:hypothetical protein
MFPLLAVSNLSLHRSRVSQISHHSPCHQTRPSCLIPPFLPIWSPLPSPSTVLLPLLPSSWRTLPTDGGAAFVVASEASRAAASGFCLLSVRPRQCRFVFSDSFSASCCVVGELIWVVLLVSAATGSFGAVGAEELSSSRDAPVDLR